MRDLKLFDSLSPHLVVDYQSDIGCWIQAIACTLHEGNFLATVDVVICIPWHDILIV